MGAAATREGEWRPVVSKVLAESVPVSALLVFIAAESGRRGTDRRRRVCVDGGCGSGGGGHDCGHGKGG